MDSTFTFYKRGIFSRSVDVYSGDISDRPKPKKEKGTQPVFSLEVLKRRIYFRAGDQPQNKALLLGNYEGKSGSCATIKGKDFISTVMSYNKCTNSSTFFYNSDKYSWSISKNDKSWTLHNHSGETLAVFDRSAYKIHKLGVLRIVANVDEKLKLLIMFTCEMVYIEVAAAAAEEAALITAIGGA